MIQRNRPDFSRKAYTNALTRSVLTRSCHVKFFFSQNWNIRSKEPIFSHLKTSIRKRQSYL